jgi:hypothetical protein
MQTQIEATINPAHEHAVVHFENDFGKKIKYVVRTYNTEQEAVKAVRNGNKGGFPVRILCGQAYAKQVNGEWELGQESELQDALSQYNVSDWYYRDGKHRGADDNGLVMEEA